LVIFGNEEQTSPSANSHPYYVTAVPTEKFVLHLSTTNSHPYNSPSITRTWYVTEEHDMNRHCTLGSICTCWRNSS